MKTVTALLCLLLVTTPVTAATDLQSHEAMREAAATFLARQTSGGAIAPRISVSRPDPRLRLAACDRPLETFLPAGARPAGNVAVGVRCNGVRRWTIYLPASVREYREVVVLTRPMPRGAKLGASDVRLEVRDTTGLYDGYQRDPKRVVGMLTRRSLAAGSVLTERAVEAPRLVRRGQQVVMVARAGGLEVRSAGNALSDGAEGDTVRVRNMRSERVVEALVTAPGTVVVQF